MCVSCLVHGSVGLAVWGLALVAQGDTRSLVTLDLALLPAAPDPVVNVAPPVPVPPAAPKAPLATPALKAVPAAVPESPRALAAAAPEALRALPMPAPSLLPLPAVGKPELSADPVTASAVAVDRDSTAPAAAATPAGAGVGAGTDVSADDYLQIAARLRSAISYPSRAREMGWEGKVLVAFRLKTNGMVADVRVVSGSGYRLLDDSAMTAVRQAAPFPPARREAELILPVQYSLRGTP